LAAKIAQHFVLVDTASGQPLRVSHDGRPQKPHPHLSKFAAWTSSLTNLIFICRCLLIAENNHQAWLHTAPPGSKIMEIEDE